MEPKHCASNELPGDAAAAGPQATLSSKASPDGRSFGFVLYLYLQRGARVLGWVLEVPWLQGTLSPASVAPAPPGQSIQDRTRLAGGLRQCCPAELAAVSEIV